MNELGGKRLSDMCSQRTASLSGTSWTSGALRFDSTSDVGTVQSSGSPILAGRPAFTMVARFRTTATYQGVGRGLYSERESATPILKFDMLDGVSHHSALLTVRDGSSHLLQVRGTVAIDDGKWHTVAMVLDGTVGYVYVDGVLDATNSNGSLDMTGYPTDTPITFGNDPDGAGDFLGDVDFFFGYSRALSASEIACLTANPYVVFEAPGRAFRFHAAGGLIVKVIAEEGTGTDALPGPSATLALEDAGAGADAVGIITEVVRTVQDLAAGSDLVGRVSVFLSVFDAGSGGEAPGIGVSLSVSEAGAGADAVSVLEAVLKTVADAAVGLDTMGGISVRVPLSDAGRGLDALGAVSVVARVLEGARGVEAVVTMAPGRAKYITVTFKAGGPGTTFEGTGPGAAFSGRGLAMTFQGGGA
jgi:hypothetical protein